MELLAIDIGGTAIKSALADETGVLTRLRETPSDGKKGGPALMERLRRVVEGYPSTEMVCISTAGQVDTGSGTVTYANENIPHYTGTPVAGLVGGYTGVPVYVDNDVNCAAMGEAWLGAGRDIADFLCLAYGTGIGGGIVLDRQIYRGSSGRAGELGHIVTHPGGLPCVCGQRGCYEQYASTNALVRRAQKADPALTDGRKLFAALKGGSEVAREVVEHWTGEVVRGLTPLVHIFNPSLLVLGGGIMNESSVLDRINELLPGGLIDGYRHVRVRQAALGNRAGMLGAVYQGLRRYFPDRLPKEGAAT